MWGTLGKYVGGKVLTAILVVATGCGVIWFWKHPEHIESLWEATKASLVWIGFVLVLPWATFFAVPLVRKFDSNAAAAVMLAAYAALDALVAFYLAEWHVEGALTWAVILLGLLAASVYNYLVAQTIDDRME